MGVNGIVGIYVDRKLRIGIIVSSDRFRTWRDVMRVLGLLIRD